jgi:hypothetical protein
VPTAIHAAPTAIIIVYVVILLCIELQSKGELTFCRINTILVIKRAIDVTYRKMLAPGAIDFNLSAAVMVAAAAPGAVAVAVAPGAADGAAVAVAAAVAAAVAIAIAPALPSLCK